MSSLAAFIHDAPPGEEAAVAKDIAALSGGNASVTRQIAQELAKHNSAALRVVKVKNWLTVCSKYNQKGGDKFYSRGYEFSVDPESAQVSGVEASDPLPSDAQQLLSKLEAYCQKHYEDAVFDVFPYQGGNVLVIKGQKLSPRNFFNGAWASVYEADGSSISGTISVDVHYFEDGNVRLKAGESVSRSGEPVSAIEAAENEFQKQLVKQLADLNETQFKALRRQLPVTRSQMVWSKATAGYKLGAELEKR